MRSCIVVVLWLVALVLCRAGGQYVESYSDGMWSNLVGLSSSISIQTGIRHGRTNVYLSFNNDRVNTEGTNLPYEYRYQGVSLSAGIRQWLPGRRIYGKISYSVGVAGDNAGDENLKIGSAGYHAWERKRAYTDLYGELFWVQRADDAFLMLRLRPGVTLHRKADSRLWTYAIAQLWASGKGENGVENRVESGAGLGYLFGGGRSTLNFELRAGHVYRGTITDRDYYNPVVLLATGF